MRRHKFTAALTIGSLIALLSITPEAQAIQATSKWGTGWNYGWPEIGSATLTGNLTFTEKNLGSRGDATFLIDPGGAARNVNPSGTFKDGARVCIENTADAAETITFDSAGIAIVIAQDESGLFIYTGSAWENITPGYLPGGTDVAIADGGTGESSVAAMKQSFEIADDWPKLTYNAMIATDDFPMWVAPVNITITDIQGILMTGGPMTGGLDECDSAGANPVAVDADISFDGGLDEDDGSLTNGTIDAGDIVRWHTTAVNGDEGFFIVWFKYTVD